MRRPALFDSLLAMMLLTTLMALATTSARAAPAHAHQHRFDDPEAYAQRWEDPARDAWQRPAALVEALGVQAGTAVADIGTGTGYLLPYLDRAVAPDGRVYAVDVSTEMLAWVRERAEGEDLSRVRTVLASGGASGLAAGSVDRAIMINVWHHIEDPGAYAADLYAALRDDGVLFIVETRPDATQAGGPPLRYRLPPEAVIAVLESAGFTAMRDPFEIDRQYVVRAER